MKKEIKWLGIFFGAVGLIGSIASIIGFFGLNMDSLMSNIEGLGNVVRSVLDSYNEIIVIFLCISLLILFIFQRQRLSVVSNSYVRQFCDTSGFIRNLYFNLGINKSKYIERIYSHRSIDALEMEEEKFDNFALNIFCESSRAAADSIKSVTETEMRSRFGHDLNEIKVVIVLLNPDCNARGEVTSFNEKDLGNIEVVNAFFDSQTWIKNIKPYLGVEENELPNYAIDVSTALEEIARGKECFICNNISSAGESYKAPPKVYEEMLGVNAKVVVPIQYVNGHVRNLFGYLAVMTSNVKGDELFTEKTEDVVLNYMKFCASLLAMTYYGIYKSKVSISRVMNDQKGFIKSGRKVDLRRKSDVPLIGENK